MRHSICCLLVGLAGAPLAEMHINFCRPCDAQIGEKYGPHHDYFSHAAADEGGGNRLVTALMYLSDVEEGGETVFPKVGCFGASAFHPNHVGPILLYLLPSRASRWLCRRGRRRSTTPSARCRALRISPGRWGAAPHHAAFACSAQAYQALYCYQPATNSAVDHKFSESFGCCGTQPCRSSPFPRHGRSAAVEHVPALNPKPQPPPSTPWTLCRATSPSSGPSATMAHLTTAACMAVAPSSRERSGAQPSGTERGL
eukprot:364705-Chlamydomonas_euryale.AAC.14